jgi:predicted RecB family nuclease
MVMEPLEEDPGQGDHEVTGSRDDLTRIRGIGPNRQQWLHDVMGIMTIHDLATAAADEIESHFRQEGQPISRIEIERWIAQAQALDQGLEATDDIDLDRDETLETPVEAAAIAEIPHPTEAVSAASGDVTPDPTWNNISTFTVAFQTRQMAGQTQQQAIVQHNESNYVATWVESEAGPFPDWMLAQVRARIPSPPSTP